jgi:hypothetical protein
MDDKTVTLIIGLAGIFSTLISSGLGIYFTGKGRSAPLRQSLFNKQLELITKIIHKQGRIRVFFTILSGSDDTYKELARDDIGECVKKFSELQEEGAAILPTELWVEVKQLNSQITGMLVEYDEGRGISENSMGDLVARETKVALLSRVVLGIDELTEESLKLFSSKMDIERIANIEVEHLKAMQEKADA